MNFLEWQYFFHLAIVFTASLNLGYISAAWKLAKLCMLIKPDKLPSLTSSYGPISLLSTISKLFEHAIPDGYVKFQQR